MSKTTQYKFLREIIWPQRMWFLCVSLLILCLTGSNLIQAKMIQTLIDSTIARQFVEMKTTCVVLAVLILMNITLSYIKCLCNARFTIGTCQNLKTSLVERILTSRYQRILKCSVGDLLKTVNHDVDRVCAFFGESLASLLSQVVMLVAAYFYLVFTQPLLAIITFLYTPIGMVITYRLNQKKGISYPKIADLGGVTLSVFEQMIIQIPVIRAFAMEKIREEKLSKAYHEIYQYEKKVANYNAYLQTACSMVSQLPRMLYLIVAIPLVLKNRISLGTMVALYEVLNYVVGPTVYFPFLLDGLLQARASAIRIEQLNETLTEQGEELHKVEKNVKIENREVKIKKKEVNRKTGEEEEENRDTNLKNVEVEEKNREVKLKKREIEEEKRAPRDAKEVNEIHAAPYINLEQVSFCYEDEREVISKLTFLQKTPGITVLTGSSGTGKTTLLDLIAGLIQPVSGTLSVQGKVFTMTQDTFLFTGTVLENLQLGNQTASKEEIVEAAKQVGAHEFISMLPQGYDTMLGDGAFELSGGQKQRISLARMLVSGADIILLDEPTSSLDEDTEKQVLKTIQQLAIDKIILVCAHRSSLIQIADRRIQL